MGEQGLRRRWTLGLALLFAVGGGSAPALDLVAASAPSGATSAAATRVLGPHKHKARHPKSRHHRARHHRAHHPKAPAHAPPTRTTGRAAGSVNVSDRSAVNTAYLRDYDPGLSVPTGWTGNESRCVAGSQAARSRASTLRALNFARSLAGLSPVTFSNDLNARSQLSALMMSANRALSHKPPSSWRCYTTSGSANAGKSNLLLVYPSVTSAAIVSLYLEDAGSTNQDAGHRRWLLNPFSTTMGSGSTDNANAITVIGPTSSSRPNPAYVSWPTAGWFPNTLEPSGRWSLSLGNRALSFKWATVKVWRNGKPISTTRNPVVDGYAQPTIVWQMPAGQTRSGTFKVQVSSIRSSATSTRYTHTYTVQMFAPGS
jgi:uncharacterized protein YkwD